jgi:putative drug exporter of the RND superfamily
VARGYARTVVAGRFVIIAIWVGLTLGATWLPHIASSDAGGLEGFIPLDSPVVQTELSSVRAFGFPLISRTVLVQHDADGLSVYTQAEAVLRAAALSQGEYPDAAPILGALPITNTLGLFPSSSERGTTALTYLFIPPPASFDTQTRVAEQFAATQLSEPEDHFVGVTGSIPARVEQARILGDSLPNVEIATLAAILLIVGLVFRAVAAPAIALGTSGIAFVIATRLAGLAGQILDIPIPSELEPLILALLLGVVTDYAIFFLSGMRQELKAGHERLDAARRAAASYGPIVTVAGLTVAAGTASLLVADFAFFRTFGPAMALAILIALVVAVTLVPALLAVLGRATFWPAAPGGRPAAPGGRPAPLADAVPSAKRQHGIELITRKPVAAAVVLVCVAGLGVAALPLPNLRLGVSFIPSLPTATEAHTAALAATAGFAPGILSPSVLLVQGDDVTAQRTALDRLDSLLEAEDGVAGVVGPGDLPVELERSVLLASSGDAARYLIVLDDEPLGALAISTMQRLQEQLPTLVGEAGLEGVETGIGGDTALATSLVEATQGDLGRIAVAALLVNFLLLVLFLRALVAPFYLLACSTLSLAAALGLMTFLFQDVLGHDGITFYVPFAAAVLLLSLGSDYNVFGVGHIWSRARDRPLREAIVQAVPEASRAITAAGVTLAASFGMLAIVPLRPFRELAFVMAVGILLDAIVVRSFLVPTLLALVGRFSGWPGNSLSVPRSLATPPPPLLAQAASSPPGESTPTRSSPSPGDS